VCVCVCVCVCMGGVGWEIGAWKGGCGGGGRVGGEQHVMAEADKAWDGQQYRRGGPHKQQGRGGC